MLANLTNLDPFGSFGSIRDRFKPGRSLLVFAGFFFFAKKCKNKIEKMRNNNNFGQNLVNVGPFWLRPFMSNHFLSR